MVSKTLIIGKLSLQIMKNTCQLKATGTILEQDHHARVMNPLSVSIDC